MGKRRQTSLLQELKSLERSPAPPIAIALPPPRQKVEMLERRVIRHEFPAGITMLPLSEICVDAKRFQFRLVHGAEGITGRLRGIKIWDHELAGIVAVWHDPSDRQTYCVNGHHRLALAKELGVQTVLCRYIQAPDSSTARAKGALINLSEGHADPLDCGKLLRDLNWSDFDLQARGIKVDSPSMVKGRALAALPSELFHQAITGELPLERAIAIGTHCQSHQDMRTIARRIRNNPKVTVATIAELSRAIAPPDNSQLGLDLFGAMQPDLSLQRAQIIGAIKSKLRGQARALVGVVKRREQLTSVKGNKINTSRSTAAAKQAQTSLTLVERLAHVSSPVSDLVEQLAQRLHDGEALDLLVDEAIARLSNGHFRRGLMRRSG